MNGSEGVDWNRVERVSTPRCALARRLELRINQEELAEHRGVHRNYAGRIERGDETRP